MTGALSGSGTLDGDVLDGDVLADLLTLGDAVVADRKSVV